MEQLTPVDPHSIEADCLVLFFCSDFYPLLDCLGLYFQIRDDYCNLQCSEASYC